MLGVPSYTSGAQTLNGTTVNLNNKLEYINIKLKIISLLYFVVNKNKDNSFKLVKPVIPYNKAIPKSNKPEIIEPKIKYFKPASEE